MDLHELAGKTIAFATEDPPAIAIEIEFTDGTVLEVVASTDLGCGYLQWETRPGDLAGQLPD